MMTAPLDHFLRHLRRRLDAPAGDGSDARLLERFARAGEEGAFAALVRRHGPMVFGVCRRVLGHEQDAEDAFQATFLVLARRAGAVRKQGSVGSWLHGVAWRLASRARVEAARRRRVERHAVPPGGPDDPAVGPAAREVRAVLDEELGHLPEKYRRAVVLCDLQGLSHEEAAGELGCPVGSMSWRLQRGRDLLRGRLAGRGVTLSAAGLAVLLEESAGAAVPAALLQAASSPSTATPQVAALAEQALRGTFAGRGKTALLGLVGVLMLGGAAVAGLASADPPADELPPAPERAAARQSGPDEPKPKAEAPRPKDEAAKVKPEAEKGKTDFLGDALPPGAVARMGTMRLRQPGLGVSGIGAAAIFAPDGKSLFTSGGGLDAYQWAVPTGKELQRFRGHQNAIQMIALSRDGKLLATVGYLYGGTDHTVRVWDVATGKELQRVPRVQGTYVYALTFSPDGRYVLVGAQKPALTVWDLKERKAVKLFAGQDDPNDQRGAGIFNSLSYSPDGKLLASSGASKIHIWEATGKKVHEISLGEPGKVAWAPDGKTLLAGHGVRPVFQTLYDAETWKPLKTWGEPIRKERFLGYAYAAGGPAVGAFSEDKALVLREVVSGKEVRRVPTAGPVYLAGFSPDGRYAAWPWGHGFDLVDLTTGKSTARFTRHEGGAYDVAYSPDGKALATAGEDRTVRLWDAATGKPGPVISATKGWVFQVAFSPDGKYLASSTDEKGDAAIRLWDAKTGELVREFGSGTGGARLLAFSPDGKNLAAATWPSISGAVYLWDAATGKQPRLAYSKHGMVTHALAWSGDGKTLALATAAVRTGNRPTVVLLTEGAESQEIATEHRDPIVALALTRDGKTVATASRDGSARVFDVRTGKERFAVEAPRPGRLTRNDLAAVAISPDGRLLALGGWDDNEVRVWDQAAGKELRRFDGHRDNVTGLAFSPDGRTLASSSRDGTALVWDVTGLRPAGQ